MLVLYWTWQWDKNTSPGKLVYNNNNAHKKLAYKEIFINDKITTESFIEIQLLTNFQRKKIKGYGT